MIPVLTIFPDEQNAEARVIKGRDGRADRTVYDQKAYLKRGRELVQITVTSNELAACYPAGDYTLDVSCFDVEVNYGRGGLRFNAFNMQLCPLAHALSGQTDKSKVA